jgi:molecular chaperone GrpE
MWQQLCLSIGFKIESLNLLTRIMIKSDKSKQENNKQEEMNDEKSKRNLQDTAKNADANKTSKNEHKAETLIEEDSKNEQSTVKNEHEIETDPKQEKISELEKQNNDLNDKYLRLFSEFDNFRKRSIKERIELTKTASAEITEAVLPVLDDLERAHKSAVENPDIDALTEGLGLILTKLKTTLKHKGLEEIENTIGESFNTDFHEAITHIPATEESQKGKIVDQIQKGYMLNGKIIRFAKVVVAN